MVAIRDLIPWKNNRNDVVPATRDNVEHPLMALQSDINRLFDDMFRSFASGSFFDVDKRPLARLAWPQVELSENDKEIRVIAEMPGIDEKDVEITIDDDALVISGEKKSEVRDDERGYSELSYGRFERRIGLPSQIDHDRIEAEYKNGVLTVTIPRLAGASESRKRIPIKSA